MSTGADAGLWSADWAAAVGASPAVWTGVLVGAMALGLVLWSLGGRLARAGTVTAGFVVGGLAVTSLSIGLASASGVGPWVLLLGVGGAIAGALLAWLLFRLWMGVMAAVLLALAVPAAVLVWSPPQEAESGETQAQRVAAMEDQASSLVDALKQTWREGMSEALNSEQVQQAMRDAAAAAARGDATDGDAALAASGLDAQQVQTYALGQARRVWDVLKVAWDREMAKLRAWWDGLATGTRTTVIGGSAVGGVIGLVLGLLMPRIMASVQTALVGALLLFFPAGILVHAYLAGPVGEVLDEAELEAGVAGVAGVAGWAAYWPTQPRAMLLSVGLITLVGLLLQCTVLRRKADS